MKRSTLIFCVLIGVGHAVWKEVNKIVPDVLNPLNIVYTNRCIEDLGCFYTGPPFYHPTNRPLPLPPANVATRFLLFTPLSPQDAYVLEHSPESLQNSTFDPQLETKFLIHGFLSDMEINDVRFATKDAMLKVGNYNVIIVDWTSGNGFPFAQAVSNTRVVGAKTARLIHFLMNETDIAPERIHIIGHSLGAHTAGYAGERIQNLGRITGLDPAGPYFQDDESQVRLDRTDALFVDIIHTDGAEFVVGGLGISEPIGHMDFYPNGGRRQLGCVYTSTGQTVVGTAVNFTTKWVLSGCDHSRANVYFLESVNNTECRFLAVLCSSYSDYQLAQCSPDHSTVVEMGFHVEKIQNMTFPAKFYLRTNAVPTFCLENSIYL